MLIKEDIMIKGLLFDLDGVLVDTAKYHYVAWKEIAEELGIDFTEKDNERLKGVSRMDSFNIILEIGGKEMSEEEKIHYTTKKNDVYLSYINKLEKEELFPEVEEFLIDARDKGYKIALGSASKNSSIILERLGITKYFDAIVDGNSVSKTKPDPEVFIKGAEALGLANEECVVFEDAFSGIEAAHNAGMLAIGVGTEENLPEADILIDDFIGVRITELLKRLEDKTSKKLV